MPLQIQFPHTLMVVVTAVLPTTPPDATINIVLKIVPSPVRLLRVSEERDELFSHQLDSIWLLLDGM